MVSLRKIEANRRNGQKSRGPRTIAGKFRSRVNARKHGLTIPIVADQGFHATLADLTHAIVGQDAGERMVEQGLIIAQAELELRRIRQARLVTIETAVGDAADTQSSDAAIAAEAFVSALPLLGRIERYERRAFLRRKKAAARLTDLQMMLEVSGETL
jgi:hypothetical protein